MKKVKVLFLIHDLSIGGAEKVLVNLVNNMDKTKFDITVMSLFAGGVNEQFLNRDIHYITIFKKAIPANSKLMAVFAPKRLHKILIKEHYDIEVAYLEGPSARIISGCPNPNTKLVSWIHCTMQNEKELSIGFRDFQEAKKCFANMNSIVYVSQGVREAFEKYVGLHEKGIVLYNTNDSINIHQKANDVVTEIEFDSNFINLIGIGKISPVKGFDRLARIHHRLITDGYLVHTYVLGSGEQQEEIALYLKENALDDTFVFLGYQSNPYKFIGKCDLLVCSSYSEGFSTAATESLIVGTPVCTVDVSGMKEMLGENNEYGVVTVNDEEALYQGIKKLIEDRVLLTYYKKQAKIRGEMFSTANTVKAVEQTLVGLM